MELHQPEGIGIPSACINDAFPFHIATDEDLRVLQVGSSMQRIAPGLAIGSPLGDSLTIKRPQGALSPQTLRAGSDQPFLLELRHSGVRLRGQFLALPEGGWMFLGSPWFDTAAEIEAAGLSLIDYPVHDPMAELLMIGQTQQMALRDLHEVNERLEQQREAVRRTERVYRDAIAAADAVAFQEDATGERYEFIDVGIERLTGLSAAEITPAMLADMVVEAQSDGSEYRAAAGDARVPQRRDYQIHTPDGRDIWLSEAAIQVTDNAGNITGRVGIIEDITERRHKETELERVSVQLDTILKLSPDGFAAFEARGRLSYCNPSFEQMMGATRAQLDGLGLDSFDDIFAKLGDSEQTISPLRELGDDDTDEVVLVTPQERTLTRSLRHMESASGDLRGWVLFLRDVTRERQIDRMKSEFLSTAAHELRTPMTSVLGFAELLLAEDYDAAMTREVATTIHRQSELLVHIVNELLDIARIEAGRHAEFVIETHPVMDIVERTVSALNIPGDQRTVVIRVAKDEPLMVLADSKKTIQALTNVLSNAFKYSPHGGDITLSVMHHTTPDRAEICIEVADQGIGMAPTEASRLFERFYRADPAGTIPGTGLGMSLVKDIIELQDGRIEVDSAKGKGTTVRVFLPAAADACADRSAASG